MTTLGPQGTTLTAGANLATTVMNGIGDQVTVTRRTRGALNTTTMDYDSASSASVYSGVGRVRRTARKDEQAGGGEITVESTTVHLPWGTTGVQVGDIVTVTDSRDASLTGRTFRVVDIPAFSAGTSLTLLVEDAR